MSQKRDCRDERSGWKIHTLPTQPVCECAPIEPELLKYKRDEFVESTQSRLQVLDHELRRLDQEAHDFNTESKVQWIMTRAKLGLHRRIAWDRLDDLKSTITWSKLAIELDNARQDLSAAIAHARRQFCLVR